MINVDKQSCGRQIIHVDMDAFYASVEQLDDPKIMKLPVIVGGDPKSRSVVSAASYKAREYGVHSAMPMATAIRLCPHAVILPVRMERYAQISRQISEIFARYTSLIEPISLDEAFLDVTGSMKIWKTSTKIAKLIKKQIKEEIGLTASVGIAPNKFLAKLASDLEKPDGFVVITERNIHRILDPLPVRKIWGIGKVTAEKLNKYAIMTIAQLRQYPQKQLQELVGNSAVTLTDLANGIDNREVKPSEKPKSISAEKTFAENISNKDTLLDVLLGQSEEVSMRLRRNGLKAKTVTLKLRNASFETVTRSRTLDEPTDVTELLWQTGKTIFHEWHQRFGKTNSLRLIGFSLSGLIADSSVQLKLFEPKNRTKQHKVDQATDKIKAKYGKNAIKRKY